MSDETGWRSTSKDLREVSRSPRMRPTAEIPEVYQFGPFRLEPAERKLLRGNTAVALTPKAFDTLHLLVRSSGHLVEKDELIRTLWPDSVVEEGNLTTNIFLLRKALGQDPEYIETVPKKGYRFVGAVRRLPTAELARPDKPDSSENGFEAKAAGSRQHAPVSLEPTHGPTTNVVPHAGAPRVREQVSTSSWAKRALITTVALGTFGALAYIALNKAWISKHQVSLPTSPTAPASVAPAAFAPPPHTIAVLPFVNLSSDKEQEYFADGLAEELLDLLAKTPGLHVIARTSSFSFKGKSDDVPTIAAKLKVANILEGSVRKSGNRLRVSTQLVRAADGEHLWSETYDRELQDIFKTQDEIAAAVVSALKLKLSPGQRSSPSRSTNTDAYFQYMLGQQYFYRLDDDRSIAAYHRAIALDPQYAAAYAGLADAELALARDSSDDAGLKRASVAAERAVELAPDQPMGYAARGYLRVRTAWDWSGAQADFDKALELGANDPLVLRRYAWLLLFLGRFPEAIAAARRATDLDPFSAQAWSRLSEVLEWSGDLSAAREAIQRSLTIDPTNNYLLLLLAEIELLDHHYAEALVELRKAGSDKGREWQLTRIAMAEYSLGYAKESQQALEEVITKGTHNAAYRIAETYAWRGEREKAFEWLERAYRQRDTALASLKVSPLLASLRSDSRYKVLLKKIGLPE